MISRSTVVVAAMTTLMLAAAASASGSVPSGSTPLIPAGSTAPYYDQLGFPQGSSSDYVVYTSHNTGFANQAPPPSPAGDATVKVRNGSGTVTTLDVPGAFEPGLISVSGSILVVVPEQASPAYDFPTSWYDLANDTHGTGDVPADALAASHDGWITPGTDGSGDVTLTDTSTSGTVTPLGTPIAGVKSPYDLDITQGPNGLLVDDGQGAGHTTVAYMLWSAPGTWTTLTTGTPSTDSVICSDAIANAAACAYGTWDLSGDDPVFDPAGALRLPLDGGTAVSTADNCATDPIVDSVATVWESCRNANGGATIASAPAAGGAKSTTDLTQSAATSVKVSLFGSQDKAFVVTDSTHGPSRMVAAVDATTAPSVVTITGKSAAQADLLGMALTPGRAVWTDNRTAKDPIWQRSVAAPKHGGVTVGHESQQATPGFIFDLAASGARTIYGPLTSNSTKLQLVGPTGPSTFTGAEEESLISISGDRVTFRTSDGFSIVDLRTGQKTKVKGHSSATVIATALAGNTLAWVQSGGSVWERDLAGGPDVRLRGALAKPKGINASVFVYGSYVGWDLSHFGAHDEQSGYRDDVTMDPAVTLPAVADIQQLSSDGVLWLGNTDSNNNWTLQPYDGSAPTVLATYPEAQQLRVDSGVIGYLDETAEPQVASLPTVTVHRPRSLGDPIAPKKFSDKGHHTWTSYQPFTAAFTSCSIAIRHHGAVVRALSCNKADMALGDAYVHWNGANSHGHRVAAGTYTWRTVVKNSAGPELGTGGRSKIMTGTITVSR